MKTTANILIPFDISKVKKYCKLNCIPHFWSFHMMQCSHTAGVNGVTWLHPGKPLSGSHISVKMTILRLCSSGPGLALQLSKDCSSPEIFWVPQGRGWDVFPDLQWSPLSIATNASIRSQDYFSENCPKIISLVFYVCIYSFTYSAKFIKKQLCARYCSWHSDQDWLKVLISWSSHSNRGHTQCKNF